MKSIMLIISILLGVSTLFSQENDESIIVKSLNSLKNGELLKQDSLISRSIMSILEVDNAILSDEDSIRRYLAEFHIFDADYLVTEVKIKSLSEFKPKRYIKTNNELKQLLHSDQYNKIGFYFKPEEETLYLIGTINYIEFAQEFILKETYSTSSSIPDIRQNVIIGKSKIDNIYYRTFLNDYLKEQNLPINEEKIVLNEDGSFEIKIDETPSNPQIPEWVIIYDSSDSPVSKIRLKY